MGVERNLPRLAGVSGCWPGGGPAMGFRIVEMLQRLFAGLHRIDHAIGDRDIVRQRQVARHPLRLQRHAAVLLHHLQRHHAAMRRWAIGFGKLSRPCPAVPTSGT